MLFFGSYIALVSHPITYDLCRLFLNSFDNKSNKHEASIEHFIYSIRFDLEDAIYDSDELITPLLEYILFSTFCFLFEVFSVIVRVFL